MYVPVLLRSMLPTKCVPDNGPSFFQQEKHYIRYIGEHSGASWGNRDIDMFAEPLESDLAVQVEYDMDEQGMPPFCQYICVEPLTFRPVVDQEWVDALNGERKAQQLDKVSYETFEIIMDRLEKEWFDLVSTHVTVVAPPVTQHCLLRVDEEHPEIRHSVAV